MKKGEAIYYLFHPIHQIDKYSSDFNVSLIRTRKNLVQIFWKNENNKVILRYSPTTNLTLKVCLEALCEWIENNEIVNSREALTKLKEIEGYKLTEEIKEFVIKFFEIIQENKIVRP